MIDMGLLEQSAKLELMSTMETNPDVILELVRATFEFIAASRGVIKYFDDRQMIHPDVEQLKITILQESYAKELKPYIDRLAAIQSMRPPEPIFLTVEQAQYLGLIDYSDTICRDNLF